MTISTTTNRVSFVGNGSTTGFATGFKFFANSDLTVTLVTDSTAAEVVQVITTNYTVTGSGVATGGTVTMNAAPAVGETLVIVREQPYTQGTDLVENDPFPSQTVEDTLDKLAIMAQQNHDAQTRSVKLSEGFTGTFDTTLPTSFTANTALVIDSAGTGFDTGPTVTAIATAAANATAAAASATAAAASYDSFDDRYLGAKASEPTLDNDGDALVDGALFFDTTVNRVKVYDLGGTAWLSTTLTTAEIADVTTVADDFDGDAHITAVGAIVADVTTVAGIAADVTTVAGDAADIATVAGISANVSTVAGDAAAIAAVASISGDVSAIASQVVGWNFATSTTMADPGSGNIRLNNATLASVTAIAISDNDNDGVDQSAYVLSWDDSTSVDSKGTLMFRTVAGDVLIFNVTALTDNAGWTELAVTLTGSNGSLSASEELYSTFSRTGDAGDGDMTSGVSVIDNLADVDTSTAAPTSGQYMRFDGTNWVPVSDLTAPVANGGAIPNVAATASVPSFTPLKGTTDLGIGAINASTGAFIASGNAGAGWTSSGIFAGDGSTGYPFMRAVNSAGAPGWTFNSDITTGMFRESAGVIGWSNTGVKGMDLDASHNLNVVGEVSSASARKLKKNIRQIDDALTLVGKLRGVTFDWKKNDEPAIGMIYEEVAEVLPELTHVSETSDYVGVRYAQMTALLIEAVKELTARVEELEGE